jgi:hypothetical protein
MLFSNLSDKFGARSNLNFASSRGGEANVMSNTTQPMPVNEVVPHMVFYCLYLNSYEPTELMFYNF